MHLEQCRVIIIQTNKGSVLSEMLNPFSTTKFAASMLVESFLLTLNILINVEFLSPLIHRGINMISV